MKLAVISLRSLVRLSLIVEGRIEDLSVKYPSIAVAPLAAADPSPTKKYLEWMVKQAAAGAKEEDIVPTVKYFHDNAHKFPSKDINAYKTLKDLEDTAKAVSTKKTKGEEKREISTEAPVIYEDENLLMIRPDTKRACIKYGKGTQWCITMSDASYYEQYIGANVVFYFMMIKVPVKNPNHAKIAIAMKRDKDNNASDWEVYDAGDTLLSLKRVATTDSTDPTGLKSSLAWAFDVAQDDSEKLPKSLLTKLKSGDKVDPKEVITYWKTLGEGEPGSEAFVAKCAMLDTIQKNQGLDLLSDLAQNESDPELREAINDYAWGQDVEFDGGIAYYTPDHRCHRDGDKPAIISNKGLRVWKKNDMIHRDSGPAVVGPDGVLSWYHEGQLHREDGPAYIQPDDSPEGQRESYYLWGERLAQPTWKLRVANLKKNHAEYKAERQRKRVKK